MNKSVQFFLGSNSCRGFYSLYEQFIEEASVETRYIIKGGAGCGKSSFMRTIASAVSDAGLNVEYILCSGDPSSLDGIYIPELKTVYVDGTAPHIIEPIYPGINDFYINLGVFYDNTQLLQKINEIKSYNSTYKGCYKKAYGALEAAGRFENGMFEELAGEETSKIILKRASGIVTREIKKTRRTPGAYKLRFLNSVNCEGISCLYDTAARICDRLYVLENDYGFARLLLEPICEAALGRGYDAIICPSALKPEVVEHLLIPELSLGFVSSQRTCECRLNAVKQIRLNSLIDKAVFRENRQRIRSEVAIRDSLYQNAIDSLKLAKHYHDMMEGLYNPHVDFGGVYALAETHAKSLLQKIKSRV